MKSQNNQLKSADIGHEFGVLTKTKHVGHVSHSIFVPEFEFDHNNLKFSKTQNFQNLVESVWTVPRDSESSLLPSMTVLRHLRGGWVGSENGNS